MSDIHVEDVGSLYLFTPMTSIGADWLNEHVESDAQTFGGSVAVEHRYAEALLLYAIADGLEVQP